MSDEIRPAMTPKEWAVKGFPPDACDSAGCDDEDGLWMYSYVGAQFVEPDEDGLCYISFKFRDPGDRHALAALALHGQPFGFTWEDVDLLRAEASMLLADIDDDELAHWRSLADRIAALLPPREP